MRRGGRVAPGGRPWGSLSGPPAGRYRVVLVALKTGARFDEDDPRGYVTLAVREGRVSVAVDDGETEVGAGQVAVLGHGRCWSGKALQDSALLMNFSWPPRLT